MSKALGNLKKMELLISLISGAIGGNIAGGVMKNLNLGLLINSIAGIVGGGLGGRALSWFGIGGLAQSATPGAALDPGALISQGAAGGLGGEALLLAWGAARNLMTR